MDVVDLARNLYELREAGYLVVADLDEHVLGAESELAGAAPPAASCPTGITPDHLSRALQRKRVERGPRLFARASRPRARARVPER